MFVREKLQKSQVFVENQANGRAPLGILDAWTDCVCYLHADSQRLGRGGVA